MKITIHPIYLAALTLLVSACATPPPASVNYPAPATAPPVVVTPPPSAPAPAPSNAPPTAPAVEVNVSERALVAAIDSYDRGEFPSAIRQLTPMVADASLDPPQLLRALKALAFSQCSVNAVTACRQSFERALKADPTFDLAAAERGHPIWGPQFLRARRAVLGK